MSDAARAGNINRGAPPGVRALLDAIDRLSRIDGWLGALCLATLTSLMIAEVAVRALSNVFPWVPAAVPAAWEISSYLMAASFTFGAAMTLRAGGHIRVTLLLARLGPAQRRYAEIATAAAGLLFTGFLAVAMINFTWSSFSRGQVSISSDAPLWMPQSVVTFGVLLLSVQFFARLLQGMFGLPLENPHLKVAGVAE